MPMNPSTMTPPTTPSGFRRPNRASARSHGAPARAARSRTPADAGSSDSTWSAMASVPDPGVEVRVARVHEEVHQDDDGHDHEIDPLDHGVVALVDRVEEKAPHARQ